MISFVKIEGKPDSENLRRIIEFYQSIFVVTKTEKFVGRINSAAKLFTVLALSDNEIVGFKIGYWLNSQTFYSWVGGVKEDLRGQGIAQELMTRQHSWCKKNGFQIVKTKTENSFKPMLILNIKNGFDIVEVYQDKKGETKIILEKAL